MMVKLIGMSDGMVSGFDFRGSEATGLTIDYGWNIGKAFADWLPTAGSVIVGAVPSQEKLAGTIIEGLRLQGRNVVKGGAMDKEGIISLIKSMGLSGGAVVSFDELEQVSVIELFQEDGKLIDSQTGLSELDELARAGNFVPAAVKGDLTAVA